MRHRERFVKQVLRLPDGTRLGAQFSKLVLDALDHARWHKRLPPLRSGYVRFRASNKSIHDIPAKYISQAFFIDPGISIIENPPLMAFDRDLRANLYRLRVASVAQRGKPLGFQNLGDAVLKSK
jgi:hypothetical protein